MADDIFTSWYLSTTFPLQYSPTSYLPCSFLASSQQTNLLCIFTDLLKVAYPPMSPYENTEEPGRSGRGWESQWSSNNRATGSVEEYTPGTETARRTWDSRRQSIIPNLQWHLQPFLPQHPYRHVTDLLELHESHSPQRNWFHPLGNLRYYIVIKRNFHKERHFWNTMGSECRFDGLEELVLVCLDGGGRDIEEDARLWYNYAALGRRSDHLP